MKTAICISFLLNECIYISGSYKHEVEMTHLWLHDIYKDLRYLSHLQLGFNQTDQRRCFEFASGPSPQDSVQPPIAILLSPTCWEFSTFQSPSDPRFPLFSDPPAHQCILHPENLCSSSCLFLLFFFIEVYWFITLYKFHVYNINFYFCIQHAHQQKVSFHLSPYSSSALSSLPSIPTSSFLVTTTLYSALTCFLLFGLFTYFFCFFIAYI